MHEKLVVTLGVALASLIIIFWVLLVVACIVGLLAFIGWVI